MKDINKVILVGRLGADPIKRQTKTGLAVTHFSVATSRWIPHDESSNNSETKTEPTEETQWHQIVTWGKQAEACALYLKKGNSVYTEGSLRSHNYEDKNGVQKTAFEIHAEQVSFLGGKPLMSNS